MTCSVAVLRVVLAVDRLAEDAVLGVVAGLAQLLGQAEAEEDDRPDEQDEHHEVADAGTDLIIRGHLVDQDSERVHDSSVAGDLIPANRSSSGSSVGTSLRTSSKSSVGQTARCTSSGT